MEIGVPHERGMVVLCGNLGYPTPGLADSGTRGVGRRARAPSTRAIASSRGCPRSSWLERSGFRGGAFAVDAACTSSLYAIKLACDGLHDGRVDIALAGGVNHADDLFLHLGFTALGALSPTGQVARSIAGPTASCPRRAPRSSSSSGSTTRPPPGTPSSA